MRTILVIVAVLSASCNAMPASPVAPSATYPAGPTTPIVSVPLPTPVPVPIPAPSLPQPPPAPPSTPTPVITFMNISRMDEIGGTPTEREYRFMTEASSDVTDFMWNFDDGSSSHLKSDQHVFVGTAGTSHTYTITLTGRAGSTILQKQASLKVTFGT